MIIYSLKKSLFLVANDSLIDGIFSETFGHSLIFDNMSSISFLRFQHHLLLCL